MKSVFVLYGGPSVEHDVSVGSARAVLNALDRSKYRVYPVFITQEGQWIRLDEAVEKFDSVEEMKVYPENLSIAQSIANFCTSHDFSDGNTILFSILHGTYGEDGGVQGFFETLDVPFVGSGVTASAVCMDKCICNEVLEQNQIPQAKFVNLNRHQFETLGIDEDAIIEKLGLPIYVKPANCGSSIGVVRVKEKEELGDAIRSAMQYDHKVVLEEEIWGRELNVSVIGNDHPIGSVPGDYEMETGYFDYELKYLNPAIVPVIPAKIPQEYFQAVADLACRAYAVTDCKGFARIDIFFTEDGELFVNEINTAPGMSALSMTPVLWNATDGTQYPDLLDRFIDWGFETYRQKKELVRTYE